eukprot:8375359-Prorocentrum_lima.AAC.1
MSFGLNQVIAPREETPLSGQASTTTLRMQWDVVHLIGFIVDAIIDEHGEFEHGDVMITLHTPED